MSKVDQLAKKTLGQAALESQSQGQMDATATDVQREIHKGTNSKKSYEEEVWDCVDRALKDEAVKGDFYVVVLFKKERVLKNVVRQYFFYRHSCPTPEYDQTVYHVRRKDKKVKYLWTIPDVATCKWMPLRKNELPDDQLKLVSMIEAFESGELDKQVKLINKEVT